MKTRLVPGLIVTLGMMGTARADDVIATTGYGLSVSTSSSDVGRGEGVAVLGGLRNDLSLGMGTLSYRGTLDVMLGGGDHVLTERLALALVPGRRFVLGEHVTLGVRGGVDARYDRVTSFSVGHLMLPVVEASLRVSSARLESSRFAEAGMKLAEPRFNALSTILLGAFGMALIADPRRGNGVVTLDVGPHGGLSLLGGWTFATVEEGKRHELPGVGGTPRTAGAIGGHVALGVSHVVLRADYTRFASSRPVGEFRGSLCASIAFVGACVDALAVHVDSTSQSPSATGYTGMLSLGVLWSAHGGEAEGRD